MGSVGTIVLALLTAHFIHRLSQRKGLLPPGLMVAFSGYQASNHSNAFRNGVAITALAGVLWIGVFFPLTQLGVEQQTDFSQVGTFDLFFLHGLLALCLVAWYVCGFAGVPLSVSDRVAASPSSQFGLGARHLEREAGIGVLVGIGAWAFVVGLLICLGVLLWMIGGSEALPDSPPELMVWIAGLPIAVRIALSLSAGFFEELFFRGFLQPRIGITFSTILFVVAHVSYAQPLMLVGVTLLSLVFGYLVKWRQSIWSAVAAHAIFDGIQLIIVIPTALRFSDLGREGIALLITSSSGLL
jgi:membrane protease YdiL (CAAX protease family)